MHTGPRTLSKPYARRIADPTGAGLVATFTSPGGLDGFAAIQHGRTESGMWIVWDLNHDCERMVPADYSRKVQPPTCGACGHRMHGDGKNRSYHCPVACPDRYLFAPVHYASATDGEG